MISLSGDGGFMYAVGDLATAAQYDIDLVTLVFNNGKFGASQHDQREGRFPGRVVGTTCATPTSSRWHSPSASWVSGQTASTTCPTS